MAPSFIDKSDSWKFASAYCTPHYRVLRMYALGTLDGGPKSTSDAANPGPRGTNEWIASPGQKYGMPAARLQQVLGSRPAHPAGVVTGLPLPLV